MTRSRGGPETEYDNVLSSELKPSPISVIFYCPLKAALTLRNVNVIKQNWLET